MSCSKQNPTSRPYECLRRGIGIGKNLSVPITSGLAKDVIRHIAKLNRVRGYSNMTKAQLIEALTQKGVRRFKPFELAK